MLRTALALLLNWAAQLIHYGLFGDSTPWMFSMFIDVITATVILARPSGKMQSALGTTFLVQCTLHTAYALTLLHGYSYDASYSYWSALRNIAILQIFLVSLWWADGMGTRLLGDRYRNWVHWRGDLAQGADHKGVVRP